MSNLFLSYEARKLFALFNASMLYTTFASEIRAHSSSFLPNELSGFVSSGMLLLQYMAMGYTNLTSAWNESADDCSMSTHTSLEFRSKLADIDEAVHRFHKLIIASLAQYYILQYDCL